MKPETLERLKVEIKTIPDKSLCQFFIVLLNELQRRRQAHTHHNKHPAINDGKDCNPIRGY